MSRKKTYYSLDKLNSTGSTYRLVIGERSNGKSYAVKHYVLEECYRKNKTFSYIRRYREDIKTNSVLGYFSNVDIKKVTDGEYDSICVYQGEIWLGNQDGLKVTKERKIGYAHALTMETHYKSIAYEDCDFAIFEEFITDSGYIKDEVTHFSNLISTLFRRRKNVVCFMVANTLSRFCPYFSEWKLEEVLRQKQGTIITYEFDGINLSVEYCLSGDNVESVIIGKNSDMINSGKWESKRCTLLTQEERKKCKKWYTMFIQHLSLGYNVEILTKDSTLSPFLYVYPCNFYNSQADRIVDTSINRNYLNKKVTENFCVITQYDTIVKDLLNQGRITFCNDLTGTEFQSLQKDSII